MERVNYIWNLTTIHSLASKFFLESSEIEECFDDVLISQ